MWDAVVVDVSKDSSNSQVNGYLVHYKGWSSRFDSWVHPDQVVEANNENQIIQVRSLCILCICMMSFNSMIYFIIMLHKKTEGDT